MEIASEIVQAQASKTSMTAAEISTSLRQVFGTLHELQRIESGDIEPPKTQESLPAQAVKPKDSTQNDRIICLECGAEMRRLTKKHLASHGMSAKENRKKYGFSMQAPLAAESLTKDWSKAAKKRALPENLRKAVDAKRQARPEANTKAATETVTASNPNRTKLRKKKA